MKEENSVLIGREIQQETPILYMRGVENLWSLDVWSYQADASCDNAQRISPTQAQGVISQSQERPHRNATSLRGACKTICWNEIITPKSFKIYERRGEFNRTQFKDQSNMWKKIQFQLIKTDRSGHLGL